MPPLCRGCRPRRRSTENAGPISRSPDVQQFAVLVEYLTRSFTIGDQHTLAPVDPQRAAG
jgi:hypothetical protein